MNQTVFKTFEMMSIFMLILPWSKKAAAGLLTTIVLPVNYFSISVFTRYKKINVVNLILLIKFAQFFLFFFKINLCYLNIFKTSPHFHNKIGSDIFLGYFEKITPSSQFFLSKNSN